MGLLINIGSDDLKKTMSHIKYSLIIPHYNDLPRLKRLMLSLPERDDLQVIVVDDCSVAKNDLEDFFQSFPNVQFYQLDSNSGAGAARNFGLTKASGEFLLFADSDDEFLPNAFEVFDLKLDGSNQISYFLSEARQDESGQPSTRADALNELCLKYFNSRAEFDCLRLKLGHVVPWAKVYKKSFVDETGVKFDEVFVANDVYFNVVNSLMAEKISVFTDFTYRVYRLSDSLTSTTNAFRLIQRVSVFARVEKAKRRLGIMHQASGSSFILQSVPFGFKTFFTVFRIVAQSDLSFGFLRMFNLSRWIAFYRRKRILTREKYKN